MAGASFTGSFVGCIVLIGLLSVTRRSLDSLTYLVVWPFSIHFIRKRGELEAVQQKKDPQDEGLSRSNSGIDYSF